MFEGISDCLKGYQRNQSIYSSINLLYLGICSNSRSDFGDSLNDICVLCLCYGASQKWKSHGAPSMHLRMNIEIVWVIPQVISHRKKVIWYFNEIFKNSTPFGSMSNAARGSSFEFRHILAIWLTSPFDAIEWIWTNEYVTNQPVTLKIHRGTALIQFIVQNRF